jgi:hypothetical protein
MIDRTTKVIWFALVVALLLGVAAAARQQDRISVAVTHVGDDAVGGQLTFAIREAIRRSAAFALVDTWGDANLGITVVTVDLPGSMAGRASAAGFTYTAKHSVTGLPIHVDSTVAVVGLDRVDSVARSAVATLDRFVSWANSR